MVTGGLSTPPSSKNYVYPDSLFEEIKQELPEGLRPEDPADRGNIIVGRRRERTP